MRGFTLIEFLIYIAIIGAMIVGLAYFAFSVGGTATKNHSAEEVAANTRFVLSVLRTKIRAADVVLVPLHNTSGATLTLNMQGAEPNITFSVSGGVLYAHQGSAQALTSSEVRVTSLTFTNLARAGERDAIRIDMTIEYAAANNDPAYSYALHTQTSVTRRK